MACDILYPIKTASNLSEHTIGAAYVEFLQTADCEIS